MIYTSYFSNYRNFPIGLEPISIAFYPHQSGFNGRTFWALTPDHKMLIGYKQGKVTQEEFKVRYLAKLDALLAKEGIDAFQELNGLILLCYEKRGEFCHRHILAEWLRSHGFEVTEV